MTDETDTTKLTITLSIDDTNLVLESLGDQPYAKVHKVIALIHEQAEAQLTTQSIAEGES